MSIASHVRTLGRGQGRARSLTLDEAQDAMRHVLAGSAAPEAVGAMLMLMRMKGEVAEEIAGFATAARNHLPSMPSVDLDWPSYAAGRTRGLPWFLLSAKLVAVAGHKVLLHGWNGPDATVRHGLAPAGIAEASDIADLAGILDQDGIAYLPLERFAPDIHALLKLRDVLGLRSCINTVARMMNPANAKAAVQGVFHPSYRLLQADSAALMGLQALSVIKGGGGEFERHPGKAIAAFGLRDGQPWEASIAPVSTETRRLADGPKDPALLTALWEGRHRDPFAEDIVLGTAELAFATLGVAKPADLARKIWSNRTPACAA